MKIIAIKNNRFLAVDDLGVQTDIIMHADIDELFWLDDHGFTRKDDEETQIESLDESVAQHYIRQFDAAYAQAQPTPEEQQAMLIERFRSAIQSWMDGEAVKLGYDNVLSACSYISTGNPKFDAEGEGFRQWRSAVWAKGYELIDEVISGKREVPDDPSEVISLLPELVINYPEAD